MPCQLCQSSVYWRCGQKEQSVECHRTGWSPGLPLHTPYDRGGYTKEEREGGEGTPYAYDLSWSSGNCIVFCFVSKNNRSACRTKLRYTDFILTPLIQTHTIYILLTRWGKNQTVALVRMVLGSTSPPQSVSLDQGAEAQAYHITWLSPDLPICIYNKPWPIISCKHISCIFWLVSQFIPASYVLQHRIINWNNVHNYNMTYAPGTIRKDPSGVKDSLRKNEFSLSSIQILHCLDSPSCT